MDKGSSAPGRVTAPGKVNGPPEGPYRHHRPKDALELLRLQNRILADLFERWYAQTEKLTAGDDVVTRWERGSVTKLILQHLAVRESAKEAVVGRLHRADRDDLADPLDGDGIGRRQEIDRLDDLIRGVLAMNTNTPEVDVVVTRLARIFREEERRESERVLDQAEAALRQSGQRLPSALYVRLHSPTHPSPEPKWYDRVGAVKAVRALYDHLRGNPRGAIPPGLDEAREQLPGVRPSGGR